MARVGLRPGRDDAGLFKYNRSEDGPDAVSYRADREMHEYLMRHPARIHDPCLATLYFLPLYAHYMVQANALSMSRGSFACSFRCSLPQWPSLPASGRLTTHLHLSSSLRIEGAADFASCLTPRLGC